MRHAAVFALVLTVLTAPTAGLAAGEKAVLAGDQKLAGDAKALLQNDTSLRQAASGVQLDVREGIVYLAGAVATEKEKEAVEEKVSTCPGVTQVVNSVEVMNSKPEIL